MNDSENSTAYTISLEEELLMAGLKVPDRGVEINIPDANTVLDRAMTYFLHQKGDSYVRLPEYDMVSEWLSNNKGKGLFMFGDCGRGKTILGRYVIPAILWKYCNGKRVRCYNMYELDDKIDEILEQPYISLDDVGTETMSVHYGKKRMLFAEIIDAVEKEGKLILITSNLDKDSLLQRYGERVLDRLMATTERIPFEGESLREFSLKTGKRENQNNDSMGGTDKTYYKKDTSVVTDRDESAVMGELKDRISGIVV